MTGRYPMPRKILGLTPIPSRRLSRVGLELLAAGVDVRLAQQVGDLRNRITGTLQQLARFFNAAANHKLPGCHPVMLWRHQRRAMGQAGPDSCGNGTHPAEDEGAWRLYLLVRPLRPLFRQPGRFPRHRGSGQAARPLRRARQKRVVQASDLGFSYTFPVSAIRYLVRERSRGTQADVTTVINLGDASGAITTLRIPADVVSYDTIIAALTAARAP